MALLELEKQGDRAKSRLKGVGYTCTACGAGIFEHGKRVYTKLCGWLCRSCWYAKSGVAVGGHYSDQYGRSFRLNLEDASFPWGEKPRVYLGLVPSEQAVWEEQKDAMYTEVSKPKWTSRINKRAEHLVRQYSSASARGYLYPPLLYDDLYDLVLQGTLQGVHKSQCAAGGKKMTAYVAYELMPLLRIEAADRRNRAIAMGHVTSRGLQFLPARTAMEEEAGQEYLERVNEVISFAETTIDLADWAMIEMHVLHGRSFAAIGRDFNRSAATVSKRIKTNLSLLRANLDHPDMPRDT